MSRGRRARSPEAPERPGNPREGDAALASGVEVRLEAGRADIEFAYLRIQAIARARGLEVGPLRLEPTPSPSRERQSRRARRRPAFSRRGRA